MPSENAAGDFADEVVAGLTDAARAGLGAKLAEAFGA
jgi:hypothetical protein